MRLFDTRIQKLKYKVLRSVAKLAYQDRLDAAYLTVPKEIVPGPKAEMRCCIYKERAIVEQRVYLALGGDRDNPNVIQICDIACEECPIQRYRVSLESCQGCITHKCAESCKFGAIEMLSNHQAHINPDKCKECGQCAKACPYGAIVETVRPCVRSCKVKAISTDKENNNKVRIDNSKCVACGACVYQCPFGAVQDVSYLVDAIKMLRESEGGKNYSIYAILAPAIVSQFQYARLPQLITGLKQLGFRDVVEAALGADATAYRDAMELKEKGKLTTSCCPAFVSMIEKHFPKMKEFVSENPSPMVETAKIIRNIDPSAKCIFIGPCTAKKAEFQRDGAREWVDCVITFEELQALLDAREIKVEELPDTPIDNASYYGRIFARSGGVTEAAQQVFKEQNIDFPVAAERCDGLEACKLAILKWSKGLIPANFIEGMACEGGCINGAATLSHTPKNAAVVNEFAKQAKETEIAESLKTFDIDIVAETKHK